MIESSKLPVMAIITDEIVSIGKNKYLYESIIPSLKNVLLRDWL